MGVVETAGVEVVAHLSLGNKHCNVLTSWVHDAM